MHVCMLIEVQVYAYLSEVREGGEKKKKRETAVCLQCLPGFVYTACAHHGNYYIVVYLEFTLLHTQYSRPFAGVYECTW